MPTNNHLHFLSAVLYNDILVLCLCSSIGSHPLSINMISNSDELKERMWRKAAVIDGYNPACIRQDACGAWIKYDLYGQRDHAYGWEIDHIAPLSLLQKLHVPEEQWDNELNLRPINCSNNLTKCNDFPVYTAALTAEGDLNTEEAGDFRINEQVLKALQNLYNGLEI